MSIVPSTRPSFIAFSLSTISYFSFINSKTRSMDAMDCVSVVEELIKRRRGLYTLSIYPTKATIVPIVKFPEITWYPANVITSNGAKSVMVFVAANVLAFQLVCFNAFVRNFHCVFQIVPAHNLLVQNFLLLAYPVLFHADALVLLQVPGTFPSLNGVAGHKNT